MAAEGIAWSNNKSTLIYVPGSVILETLWDAITCPLYWGVLNFLNIIDNPSQTLQAWTLSACAGQRVLKTTLETLQSIWSDECFNLFWEYIELRRSLADVSSPILNGGNRKFCTWASQSSTKSFSKNLLWGYLPWTVIHNTRFMRNGFQMLQKLMTLLTHPHHSETVKEVLELYKWLSHSWLPSNIASLLHTASNNLQIWTW